MKNFKRIVCIALVVISLFSCMSIATSAKSNYSLKTYYSSYAYVKLSNTRKPGYIYVHNYDKVYGSNNYHYVKLTNANGGWLYEGRMGSNKCYQQMYLGNDHSAYRVYVRSAHNSGSVSIANCQNCKIS